MSQNNNNRIDFIEFPADNAEKLNTARSFYETVFSWSYKSWGENYVDTTSSGLNSGINADPEHRPQNPLVVIYSENLDEIRTSIIAAHGVITKDIFSFPGGRRFHFKDPAGNELAVWSDQ